MAISLSKACKTIMNAYIFILNRSITLIALSHSWIINTPPLRSVRVIANVYRVIWGRHNLVTALQSVFFAITDIINKLFPTDLAAPYIYLRNIYINFLDSSDLKSLGKKVFCLFLHLLKKIIA